jgi:hypothetical protein
LVLTWRFAFSYSPVYCRLSSPFYRLFSSLISGYYWELSCSKVSRFFFFRVPYSQRQKFYPQMTFQVSILKGSANLTTRHFLSGCDLASWSYVQVIYFVFLNIFSIKEKRKTECINNIIKSSFGHVLFEWYIGKRFDFLFS